MIQTRILFSIGCVVALTLAPARAEELLRRQGRFIDLTTDLESAEEADSLVASFDAAVPQWIRFWNFPDDALDDWKVEACVIRNKAEFDRQGLIPSHIPEFPFGYSWENKVWVLAQESEYYTRHLLLHEGVHSLAFRLFRGAGPTWYQEGTAELLSTHRGENANLRVNQIPKTREEAPYWGRFKLIGRLRNDSLVPTLETIMRYQPDLSGDVATYGWSWAASMIMDAYPEYRPAFLAAAQRGRDNGPQFNRQLKMSLQKDWPILAARWRMMCHDLDYGFDWSREQVQLSAQDPLWDGRDLKVSVAADHGWQSVGVRIPRNATITIECSGEITLAEEPKPWISQPAGITFQFHRGRPLGQLLFCILPNASDPHAKFVPPLKVESAELVSPVRVDHYSWLLFRVNDAVGDLADNRGSYEVTIRRSR